MATCTLLRSRSRSQRVTEKKAEGWAVTIREKISSSVSFIPLLSIFSFIFSNEWDIWNAEISRISLFIFLPRSGLFVYPNFQPPWDNSTGPTLFQNFTVWGSAGGAQVCFFNFLKLEMSFIFLWWLILHLYLKDDDLFLGEDCYIITALRSQQHHRCVCQIVVEWTDS